MSNTSNFLTPEEIAAYQARRDSANVSADRSLAQLAYQRAVAEQNYGIGRNRVETAWDQNWHNQLGGFARRNLGESGVYHQAMTNWAQQKDNALADQLRSYTQGVGALDQQQGTIEAIRNSAVNQIEQEQQARQAMLAAQIRGVQQ